MLQQSATTCRTRISVQLPTSNLRTQRPNLCAPVCTRLPLLSSSFTTSTPQLARPIKPRNLKRFEAEWKASKSKPSRVVNTTTTYASISNLSSNKNASKWAWYKLINKRYPNDNDFAGNPGYDNLRRLQRQGSVPPVTDEHIEKFTAKIRLVALFVRYAAIIASLLVLYTLYQKWRQSRGFQEGFLDLNVIADDGQTTSSEVGTT